MVGAWLALASGCSPGTGGGGGTRPPPSTQADAGTWAPPPDGSPADGGTGGPTDGGTVTRKCTPTAGADLWVLEGQTLTAQVACATAYTDAALRFSIPNLPSGATWDEATRTLRWTPRQDQSAVYRLTLQEASTGETGSLRIGVVENGGAKIQDAAAYTEEYGLPVVHLFFDPSTGLSAGGYRPAELVYRGRRYALEAKYRGATSSVFPKRSLTLRFPDEDLFDEPVFGGPFLDRKRVTLISTFNDNSYLRTRLAFDLWNRMAPEHVQVKTFSAVVYLNGSYRGLYTVADHVSKRLMSWHGLDKDSDLYKHVLNDANFSRLRQDGTPKASLHEQVEKKEGVPEEGQAGAFTPYDALVAWISDADADTFRAEFAKRLAARDYEDWWIFNTLVLGTDSMAKNSYHAYDTTAGGPWRFIPWDLDASLGQNFDTRRSSPTARMTFASDNLLFRRMLEEPTIAGPMRERYRALLRGPLGEAVVQELIDGYVEETAPSARRDWAVWREWYRNFGGPQEPYSIGAGNFPMWHTRTDFNEYEGEVQYVRDWVRTRWRSLESGGVP